ncbi:hypothetical protein PACILC2_26660 [Paenibacillus cisolokensis]|uniref:RNA 2-O ribose methyltransferase substrate binding domain-containing protein n=2 Tax=Paenibacillus cisolokensis TaxID=1658519 RepID=A0ABQ4N829_9BACL|nr:hypothetical protein PACILC2_26660 [Paenibacillus cisolokensis]
MSGPSEGGPGFAEAGGAEGAELRAATAAGESRAADEPDWLYFEPDKPAHLLNPVVLAYIGDAVFELMIRQRLVAMTNHKPHHLHREATGWVSAKAQRRILERWEPLLTEEEADIVRRGRNAKSGAPPKMRMWPITARRRRSSVWSVIYIMNGGENGCASCSIMSSAWEDLVTMERNKQQDPNEWIAGKHPVLEALRAGREINKIWVAEGSQKGLSHIVGEARKAGIVVQAVDRRKLDQMVPGAAHQGVIAQAAPYRYAEVEELLDLARARGEAPFLLILDEIEDPHNLGSILRTAECTGVHGVIIPKRRSVGLTATVSKTSAGAAEYVPVARVTNLAQTMERLKEAGIWIAGTDVAAGQDVYRADFNVPLAVVIGNENKGIGRLVKQKCDFLVRLPMFGRLNSLNASVAAGVLMYEVVRQRRGG